MRFELISLDKSFLFSSFSHFKGVIGLLLRVLSSFRINLRRREKHWQYFLSTINWKWIWKFLKNSSFSKVFTKFIFPQGITRLHNCVKFIFGGQFNSPTCSYPTLNKLYFCGWNVPTFQPRPGNPFHFLEYFSSQNNDLENKSEFTFHLNFAPIDVLLVVFYSDPLAPYLL